MTEKKKPISSVLSVSRLALILLLSMLLTLPALADGDDDATIPVGEGEIQVVIEASENENEDIVLETGDVTGVTQSEEDKTSALQQAVNDGIEDAQGGIACIELEAASYEIGTLLLKGNDDVQYIELTGREDGGTTIKGNIDVSGVIVNLINIILGGDKTTIELENQGEKTASLEGAVLSEGTDAEVLIIRDQDLKAYEESHVDLDVSPGAHVVADLEVGKLNATVRDDGAAANTVTLSGNNSVGFAYQPTYCPKVTVQSKENSSGKSTVNIMKTAAEGADFVVKAARVNLREEIQVKSLKVIASSEESVKYDPDFGILEDIPGIGGYVKDLNIRNVVDMAVVNILSNVTAKNDITVYSYITQTGTMLGGVPLDIGINVKIGTAEINVAKGVSITSSDKNVTLKSTVRAEAGYDEYGNTSVGLLPVSTNVFINSAAVTLEDDVSISAKGNIVADAMSTIKASACCQMGTAPVSLSVNVILNDSATTLGKNVRLEADGDISLLSSALTDASAAAERKSTATGLNGVYLATNVVIQDSNTNVADMDMITAGGNVTVSSKANVNATDEAISSATSKVESGEKSQSVKSLLTGTAKSLITKVGKAFVDSDLFKDIQKSLVGTLSKTVISPVKKFFTTNGGFLEKATKLLGSSGYSVSLDQDAQSKGSVKTSVDDSEIKIKVESDYKVEKVLVRYLLSVTGKSSTNPEEKYTFTPAVYDETSKAYVLKFTDIMTDYPVVLPEFKVYVFYGDLNDSVELHDVSSDDDEDDDFTLDDFFNSAMESAADENDADTDLENGTIQLLYSYTLNGKQTDCKGIVITDVMAAGVTANTTGLSGLTHVPTGKNVRLNVNPAQGYKLNTLEFSYTNSSGETSTGTITQNSAGHYILQVPTDIADGSDLTVKADFKEDDGTAEEKKPSTFQFTGSLGVGVVINRNNTTIDAGKGEISAGGKLNLIADATTNVSSTGNGTAVGEDDVSKAKVGTVSTSVATMGKTSFDVEEGDKLLTVIGMMKDEKTCGITKNGTVYTITLNASEDYGYTLPKTIALNVLSEDNRMHTIAVSGKDGVYTADVSKLDLSADTLSGEGCNLDEVRSMKFVATYSLKSYKLSLDVVTHKVSDTEPLETYGSASLNRSTVTACCDILITTTPKVGYEASAIYLSYKLYKDAVKKDPDDVEEKQIVATSVGENKYSITLLAASELLNAVEDSFKVSVNFSKKAEEEPQKVSCAVKSDIATGNYVVVDSEVQVGAEVKLALAEANKKTYRINSENIVISYTDTNGQNKKIELDADTLSFRVPSDVGNGGIEIGIEDYNKGIVTQMHVDVKADTVENGSIVTATNTTCAGDKLLVTIKPSEGYVVSTGSVQASFEKGTETLSLGKGKLVSKNVYAFEIPESVKNDGGTVTVTAKLEEGDDQTTSLGVGTAVNVIIHRNNVTVSSGSLVASELNLTASTAGKGVAKALSGYNATTKGIAGAVAVQVIGYKTNAILSKGVEFNAAALNVTAKAAIASLNTSADATGKKTAGVTGVGTGVAVAVNGVDTFATVEDGVIDSALSGLKSIHVSASNSIEADGVTSKAGAKTKKTGISPVVALNICGSYAESYLGKAVSDNAQRDYSASSVTVDAANSVAHTMTLDAGASATNLQNATTLLAGAFGINILNDVANAVMQGGVSCTDAIVKVDAESVSTLSANVKASSSGASQGKKNTAKDKGSADTKADAIIQSGSKLAAGNGTKATSPTTISEKTQNRQTAQTSEGSIAGAAAFVLNIQSNTATSKISKGVSIKGASGTQSVSSVAVNSRTQTAADITADGSATLKKSASAGSDKGIGVAVAINIVSNTCKSIIESEHTIRAAKLSVEAGMTLDKNGKEVAHEIKTTSISGASATGISVAGSVALAVLHNSVEAKIEKGLVFVSDATTVKATDTRTAETTATAAATAAGAADKNASKSDSNKAADADSSKSVGVGASFAMIYGENEVLATIAVPDGADVGALTIYALSDHSEESTSVAGSDPISSLTSSVKLENKTTDVSADASVAINAIDTTVCASLSAVTGSAAPVVKAKTVRISAKEKGKSKTDASGFAMGKETAVGAAVAVNLNSSNVEALNQCVLKVSGDDTDDDDDPHQRKSIDIYASGEVTEENCAYATAIGADILRYVEKYKDALNKLGGMYAKFVKSVEELKTDVEALTKIAQEFLDGTLFEKILTSITSGVIGTVKTTVNNKITDLFNKKKSSDAPKANSSLPVSVNILRAFGVGTQTTDKLDELTSQGNKETNAAANGSDPKSDKSVKEALKDSGAKGDVTTTEATNNSTLNKDAESFQLAAAVAVSVSSHDILAENSADMTTVGGVSLCAESSVDAIAHATGAAVSANGGTGSIAMGVAVKVDSTSTIARVAGNILVGAHKDISITADSKENTGDTYADLIGIQAVAGSASGDAKLAISGAVAVFISSAKTVAELCENCSLMAENNAYAGSVTIEATEIARQTLRTVAAAASSGNVTLGASVGTFITKNTLKASVGKSAAIKAKTIRVKAERRSVTVEVDDGETSAETQDETDADGNTTTLGVTVKGLIENQKIITINTKDATTTTPQTTTVSVNAKSLLQKLEKALNSLSGVDYYIAVDSGSASVSGQSTGVTAVAGSVCVVVISNTVEASIGEGATLESEEDCSIEADSAEQSRVIGGAATVNTGSKTAVGAVIAFVSEENSISALVEDNAQILSGGKLTIHAQNSGLTELYTVSAVVAGQQADAAVAATINVLLSDAKTSVKLGSGKAHKAATAVLESLNSKSLTLVTVSPAVGSGKVQVGGAVTVLIEQSKASADLSAVELTLRGTKDGNDTSSLSVLADNTHSMTLATASASVGSGQVGVAGVISTLVDDSSAEVLAQNSKITSGPQTTAERTYAGNVSLSAKNNSKLLQVNVECTAGTSTVAVGVSFMVSVLRRNVLSDVSNATIAVSNGSLSVTADSQDMQTIVGAGAGVTSGSSVQGNIVVIVENNNVSAKAHGSALTTTRINTIQNNDILVRAQNTSRVYGVAGTLSIAGGSAAAGATVVVMVNNTTTEVDVDEAILNCISNVNLRAQADNRLLLVAVGVSGSSGSAIQASIVTAVNTDTVRVNLGNASVYCYKLNIDALGDSNEVLVAGSATAGGSASVGPALLVFVKNRTVEIISRAGGTVGNVDYGCAIAANALANDKTLAIVIAAGGGGAAAVQIGASVEVIKNNVTCDIDAEAYAGNQTVSFKADSKGELSTYAVGAGFGGAAAVVPVIVVLYQRSNTITDVSGKVHGNNLDVLANSNLKLDVVAAGASIGGSAGIGGTFAVVVNEGVTKALFSNSFEGKSESSALRVLANDKLDFNSDLFSLAGGGAAGVAVTAAVSVIKNTVHAAIDPGADASERSSIVAKSVEVSAESERTVQNLIGAAGIGGTAGVALNVNVLVAGSALPQDAYESIVYGNGTDQAKTFDADALITSLNSFNPYLSNHNMLDDVTLSEDIVGNSQRDSEAGLGDSEGVDTDGLLPDDLDSEEDDFEKSSDSEEKLTEKQTTRGEDDNIVPAEDSDLAKGADMGKQVNYNYDNSIQNCIEAWIDRSVIKSESVQVSALDSNELEMNSLSAAVAGMGGGGVGVTVVVLHSNVLASVGSNAELIANQLDVNAESKSDEITICGGVFGGGGLGGMAVAVAVAHLDDVIVSRMDGTLTKNTDYASTTHANISSRSAFTKVDASTGAVAVAGLGAVNASVAVVTLNGTLSSVVSGTISKINEVNIYTILNNSIAAHAANVAGSALAINAGVAVASETLTVRAALEKTALVEGAAKFRVMNVGEFDSANNSTKTGEVNVFAENVAVSIGLASISASVAVSTLKPTVSAEILGSVQKGTQNLEVSVMNRISTETKSDVTSVSVSGLAVGANVILSYNDSVAKALVSGSVKADSLLIASYLSADSTASMTGLSAALGSLGVSVAYANMKADNRAILEGDGQIEVTNLQVFAGGVAQSDTKGGHFTAEASLISGSAGVATAGLNLALAVNEAVNMARISHSSAMKVNSLVIKAFGNPNATAETEAYSVSLANLSAAVSVATLNFAQSVIVDCSDMTVSSNGYTDIDAGSYFYNDSTEDGLKREDPQAYAKLDVCAASLIDIKANVAYAKNRAASLVKLTLGKTVGNLTTENIGAANVKSEICSTDGPIALLAAGANVALSYAQGEFITEVNCPGVKGKKLSMKTDAVTDSISDAVSNGAGISAAALEANVIIAKATSKVTTALSGTTADAKLDVKSAEISNVAESHTQALLDKAPVCLSAITLGGNVVESILATESSATMKNFSLVGAPTLNVSSSINADAARKVDSDADALARYNGNATDENSKLSISAIDGKVTVVLAKNYTKNSAELANISGQAGSTSLNAASHATALADCGSGKDSDNFSLSLVGVGVIVADSVVESENSALADAYTATTPDLSIKAEMNKSNARSLGGVSSMGGVSAYAVDVNYSLAVNKAKNNATLSNSGTAANPVAIDALTVLSEAEDVYASSYVGTSKLSVSAVSSFSAQADAENRYEGKSLVENCYLTGKDELLVESKENQNFHKDGAEYVTDATVGASGSSSDKVTLTIVGDSTNKATANSDATVSSLVEKSTLNGYDLTIQATGRSDVNAKAATGTTVALQNVRVTETEANANGTVEAAYKPNSEVSTLNSLNITADGAATSHSTTATSGSNVAVSSANVNKANADSALDVKAALEDGKIHVLEDAQVQGIGTAQVEAKALTPNFNLGGLSVAANYATAHSGLSITTDVVPSELTVDGKLETRCLVPTEKVRYQEAGSNPVMYEESETSATVQPSGGDSSDNVSISLIGATTHTAIAKSEHTLLMNLGKDNSVITADTLLAESVGNGSTSSTADNHGTQVGLYTTGNLYSEAKATDSSSILVGGKSLTTSGNMKMESRNDSSNVDAVGMDPGKLTAFDNSRSDVKAIVEKNLACIEVQDNTALCSTDQGIALKAYNAGHGESAMNAGKGYSLGSVNYSSIPVTEEYDTHIKFGKNSDVRAKTNLEVSTLTASDAKSSVDQSSASLIFNIATMYGDSTIVDNSKIEVGDNASLVSESGSLALNILQSSDDVAITKYDSTGFIGKGTIQAKANYTGSNELVIGDSAQLRAENGKLSITQDSSNVKLSTIASCDNDSIVSSQKVNAVSNSEQNHNLTLGNNATLYSGSDMKLEQNSGNSSSSSDANLHLGSILAGGSATAESKLQSNENMDLSKGTISARSIKLAQVISKLGLKPSATANKGADATAKATQSGTHNVYVGEVENASGTGKRQYVCSNNAGGSALSSSDDRIMSVGLTVNNPNENGLVAKQFRTSYTKLNFGNVSGNPSAYENYNPNIFTAGDLTAGAQENRTPQEILKELLKELEESSLMDRAIKSSISGMIDSILSAGLADSIFPEELIASYTNRLSAAWLKKQIDGANGILILRIAPPDDLDTLDTSSVVLETKSVTEENGVITYALVGGDGEQMHYFLVLNLNTDAVELYRMEEGVRTEASAIYMKSGNQTVMMIYDEQEIARGIWMFYMEDNKLKSSDILRH